jgi:hypothetical protein
MGLVLIECSAEMLEVAKAALANKGGTLHGVFEDIARDAFWLKAEIASCAEIAEGACIPVAVALIEQTAAGPVLSVGDTRDVSFRLVQEVK